MSNFNYFKERFLYWKNRFGLNDWVVNYFKKCDYENGCPYARVGYILEQHECWVYFYGEDEKDIDINEKAFHEVCHLLLADLNCQSDRDEHAVINRLIACFLK